LRDRTGPCGNRQQHVEDADSDKEGLVPASQKSGGRPRRGAAHPLLAREQIPRALFELGSAPPPDPRSITGRACGSQCCPPEGPRRWYSCLRPG
jgi:hypothetical protein